MNDSLVGTWIKLANVVIACTYVVIQQHSAHFQTYILHLSGTLEDSPEKGLKIKVPLILLCFHIIINIVIVIHVCVAKFKNRNNTPVIQINIPNPSHAPPNNPPIAINNQAYNNDLISFSIHLLVMFILLTMMAPFFIIMLFDLIPTLADFFNVTVKDFFTIFFIVKGFIQTFIVGFLCPLLLIEIQNIHMYLC